MLSRLIVLLALSCLSLPLLADTVWMKNGDRLTGKVSLLNNNKLILDTDYAGSVSISWNKVSTLETKEPLIIKLSQDQQEKVKAIKPSKEGKIQLVNGGEPQEIALNDITQIIKPKPLVEDLIWSGKIGVALDYKKGEKNTSTADLDFQTKLQHGKWRHTISGEYYRKSTDGNVSTDNYQLDYALDRFINENWFWQNNANYKIDRIEDLYKQYTFGTGPGYQFWDNSLGSFSLATLVNLSKYEYRNKNNRTFTATGLRWEYNRYLLGKSIELFSNGDLARPFATSVAKYALDGNIGLRYKVNDWASFNIRINRNIVSGDSKANINETRYIIGFGVNW